MSRKAKFALVGDLHYGSAYRRDDLILDFTKKANKDGVTDFFQVGDILEGQYKHHRPCDLDAHGFEEQASQCFERLPRVGKWCFIEGNHDEKFGAIGHDTGRTLERHFVAKGRKDLKCVGKRLAFVEHKGLKICLFHPSFGQDKASTMGFNPVRMAPMSALEKFLTSVKDRENPDIVAVGHWHQTSYFTYRGMHVYLCGTFQGPGGSFGNSLASCPSVGSWIVSVDSSAKGRQVTSRLVSYHT